MVLVPSAKTAIESAMESVLRDQVTAITNMVTQQTQQAAWKTSMMITD